MARAKARRWRRKPGPYKTYAGPYLTNEAALRLAELLIEAASDSPRQHPPLER